MATMHPPTFPDRHTPNDPATAAGLYAERAVYHALEKLPDARYTVIYSLSWKEHGHPAPGEVDFIVVDSQRAAFLVLEVKAAQSIQVTARRWQVLKHGEWKAFNPQPLKQAEKSGRVLVEKMKADNPELFETHGNHTVAGVVFPNAYLPRGARHLPLDVPPACIIDRTDLSDIELAIGKLFDARGIGHAPDADHAKTLLDFLLPSCSFFPSHVTEMEANRQAWQQLDEHQTGILDLMGDAPRLLVPGVAGSGKTIIALEAARRSAEDGRRSLYLCRNALLANEMLSRVRRNYNKLLNDGYLQSYSFEGKCHNILERSGGQTTSQYHNKLLEKLDTEDGAEGRVDDIYVDEGQDFGEDALPVVERFLKDRKGGRLWVFYDPFQIVRLRNQRTLVDAVPQERKMSALRRVWYNLARKPVFASVNYMKRNFRNTKKIGQKASQFVPDVPMEFLTHAPTGSDVRSETPPTLCRVVEKAAEQIWEWRNADVREHRIALIDVDVYYGQQREQMATLRDLIYEELGQSGCDLLAAGHRHRDGAGRPRRDRSSAEPHRGDLPLFMGTERPKGIEVDAVVLLAPDLSGLEADQRNAIQNALYVGATRARHYLTVFNVPTELPAEKCGFGAAHERLKNQIASIRAQQKKHFWRAVHSVSWARIMAGERDQGLGKEGWSELLELLKRPAFVSGERMVIREAFSNNFKLWRQQDGFALVMAAKKAAEKTLQSRGVWGYMEALRDFERTTLDRKEINGLTAAVKRSLRGKKRLNRDQLLVVTNVFWACVWMRERT